MQEGYSSYPFAVRTYTSLKRLLMFVSRPRKKSSVVSLKQRIPGSVPSSIDDSATEYILGLASKSNREGGTLPRV